jgi:hypothetical protein
MSILQDGEHEVTRLIIHTSDTPTGWSDGMTAQDVVDEIRRWHVEGNEWSDIGYHRVIMPDGEMGVGRSIYRQGAGVAGKNEGSVHICLVPVNKVDKMGTFEDFYTDLQRKAVSLYIDDLEKLTGREVEILGHNQFSNKLCPGFKVSRDTFKFPKEDVSASSDNNGVDQHAPKNGDSFMFSGMLGYMMNLVFAYFNADEIREEIDDFIDKIEAKVEAQEDSIKKQAMLRSLKLGRDVTGIPDDYNGDED